MSLNQLWAKKSLEVLAAEAKGDNRLRRILGPIGLTSLGVGAIIGAGIFVMTGRAAAQDAGPAIMLSYVVAGLGCLFAALCYAEFASTTPVAGSAYTYAYATLGELFAWFIGWDLILEYAMACACVAASWSKYLNEFLRVFFGTEVDARFCSDPFSHPGAIANLPAMFIILACTAVLVIGIRESATMNAILVGVKLAVVLFVIAVGWGYINRANWTEIPVNKRLSPELRLAKPIVEESLSAEAKSPEKELKAKSEQRLSNALAIYYVAREEKQKGAKLSDAEINTLLDGINVDAKERKDPLAVMPTTEQERTAATEIAGKIEKKVEEHKTEKWGILALFGIDAFLSRIDESTRSGFMPYGISGIMLGAAIVFFAYIGFDSISTHSEEAKKPARDVPIAILSSLVLCTVLYIGVAAVITGMVPYPDIDPSAAVAAAFRQKGEETGNEALKLSGGLIATGALAGMTSVLLITFLSQARIFLAMARDGLLPHAIFGAIHPRFRTPHISTMLTGCIIAVVAAFTPILKLEEMVNIGTLAAFVIVCAAVLLLRIQRPDAYRPFRAPLIFIVGPLGILVNLVMMLFLPVDTWLRLIIWLLAGMVLYFSFGFWNSTVGKRLRGEPVNTDIPDTSIMRGHH